MNSLRPTLALASRTLREDTRLLRVHFVRFLFVSGILWLLYLAQQQARWLGAPGLRFFESVCYLDLLLITLVGVGYFTSTITEEKEEQTIGLLTMADIGPTAMLVGKLAPRLFGAALVLLAQFPFTLLAVTLGGVLTHQVIAAALSLFSYLVLVAGLGLFFSVVSRTTMAASRGVVIVLAALLILPLLVEEMTRSKGLWNPLRPLSPFLRIDEICRTGFAGSVVGSQAIFHFVTGTTLAVLSRALFSRFVRDEPPGGPSWSLFDVVRRMATRIGPAARRGSRRAWSDALVWKDFHFIAGGFKWMALKLVFYPMAVFVFGWWILLVGPNSYLRADEIFGGTFMIAMPLVLTFELALLGARTFSEEIRWQTLPTIAMLPLPWTTIVRDKIAGCLMSVAPSILCFFLGVLIYPKGLEDFLRHDADEVAFYWFCSQCVLFIHLATWYSLYARWGALPLAFATIFLTNACCLTAFEGMSINGPNAENVIFTFLMLATGAALVTLYFAIGERLQAIVAK